MHNNKMRRRLALGLVALALGAVGVGSIGTYSASEVVWTQSDAPDLTESGASADFVPTTGREEALEVIWT